MRPWVILGAVLAACAPTYYVRPGGTPEAFEQDKAACQAQAMAADNPFMIPDIVRLCLRGKGWRPGEPPQAVSSTR